MIEIQVAKHAGFCFGVRRACECAEELLKEVADGVRVATLGELIHNDGYNRRLHGMGVERTDSDGIDSLADFARQGGRAHILIRAHGEKKETLLRLAALSEEIPTFRVSDCTCPFVGKLREIAARQSGEGKFFILIGDRDHPEVVGVMSCADPESSTVLRDSDELRAFLSSQNAAKLADFSLSVAAQTTFDTREWKKCLEILKKLYTNAKIFDTICTVTESRQKETAELARSSDAMIVIGSKGSSNSRKLYEISRELCPLSLMIDSALDLPPLNLPAGAKLSITAGASTPDSVIQEVKQKMNEQNTENFAQLLEESIKTLNTGEIVDGVIISIAPNEIHVDLGSKTTGIITHDKLTDDPGAKLEELFKVGDTVRAKVIKVSDVDGIATLDKTRVDSEKNWDEIASACKTDRVFEGKVTEAVKGGVVMSVNSVRVFIPASQTGIPKEGDLSTLVGTTQKIMIIDIKTADRRRAYGSIRAVSHAERKAKEDAFWANIEEGKVYTGKIRSLTDFGAFVDLGGVDGMVHVSELSWRHIRRPSEVVAVGDTLTVYVKSFDREKNRIALGYKTDEMNPWFIFTQQYAVDSEADVKIVSLMPFGAFAEIVPGVDGLIHITQITDHKIAKPDDVLAVGDTVRVKITSIDEEKHQVGLSIRALMEEAAPAEAEAAEGGVLYSTDGVNIEGEAEAE